MTIAVLAVAVAAAAGLLGFWLARWGVRRAVLARRLELLSAGSQQPARGDRG